MEGQPSWLTELFKLYPDRWIELAIKKAKFEVTNLLRETKTELVTLNHLVVEEGPGLEDCSKSEEVVTAETLRDFRAIVARAWSNRTSIAWPQPEVRNVLMT